VFDFELAQLPFTGEWRPRNFGCLIVGPKEYFQVSNNIKYMAIEWYCESYYQYLTTTKNL